jgi:tetratricopeptide (TPR) repeat protein
MNTRTLLAVIPASLVFSIGTALAHDKADQLGKVTFPTSCSPKVQKLFETGVAMIHSYWFGEARKTFEAVLKDDPNCAMAHWGIALDYLGNSLSGAPPAKAAAAGWESMQKAIAIGAKTERERDWINSLAAYYRDHDKTPVNARLAAYTKATEALTQKYPDDFEAWVFHALNLQASAPKSDIQYRQQLQSAQILETLLLKSPEHPGVTHFLIHAYDYPPLADKGISAARRYAKLAPAAPHARHMPSHIYSMVGLWEESIASNLHSMAIRPDYYHAADFVVYAHLQLGQDEKAKAMMEKAREVFAKTQSTGPGALTGFNTGMAAMPARLVLERADWKGAAALPPVAMPNIQPMAESLTRFARGLGMARSGDLAGAKAELAVMQKLRATLEKTDLSYWADRTEEQMLAVSAWIALAEGNKDRAEQLMRTAADNEDNSVKHVAMENRLYPMRELYADLLLEMGQAAPALREFEAALKAYPNRYRSIYGIARAADATGDRQKAAAHYNRLMVLAKNADTQRPELAKARTYVAQR